MSAELISLFTATFVTFFVLIDAPGVAPIFATLTAQGDPAYRRKMAFKSTFVATIIMFAFAFGGSWVLGAMHISIDAFRAAGGNLLLTLVIFLAATPLVRLMGASVAGALTRILGVILAALSVQLLIDGIKGAFGLA